MTVEASEDPPELLANLDGWLEPEPMELARSRVAEPSRSDAPRS
jgi:hypothetical protein